MERSLTWFMYIWCVWYSSIHSVPAITMSLSSHSSFRQPPLYRTYLDLNPLLRKEHRSSTEELNSLHTWQLLLVENGRLFSFAFTQLWTAVLNMTLKIKRTKYIRSRYRNKGCGPFMMVHSPWSPGEVLDLWGSWGWCPPCDECKDKPCWPDQPVPLLWLRDEGVWLQRPGRRKLQRHGAL